MDESILVDLGLDLAGIRLKNPVVPASGTFGIGQEYAPFFDLRRLGALITKSLTLEPREGNPPPRTSETPSGMLNSIGLQNPGVDAFIEQDLPYLEEMGLPILASVAGAKPEDYVEVARRLEATGSIAGIELNLSCPNIKAGGMEFGTDAGLLRQVVELVARSVSLPLIVKLSPNVTDIVSLARAAVDAGASALSLINTLQGMAIDVRRRRPKLGAIVGGLSGPAVKPVAVRMVWQVRQAVDVPIIGMGGIRTIEDALEFILAGANAVAVGTASFVRPETMTDVIEGLERYCREQGVTRLQDLVGAVRIGG